VLAVGAQVVPARDPDRDGGVELVGVVEFWDQPSDVGLVQRSAVLRKPVCCPVGPAVSGCARTKRGCSGCAIEHRLDWIVDLALPPVR
jgi:hypothetical protein